MNTESKVAPAGSGRLVLLLVAAMFFLPVIGAIVLFQSGWRPQSQVNHGELVIPARPVSDVALMAPDGVLRAIYDAGVATAPEFGLVSPASFCHC